MRDKLIELLEMAYNDYLIDSTKAEREKLADFLLENGVAITQSAQSNNAQDCPRGGVHSWRPTSITTIGSTYVCTKCGQSMLCQNIKPYEITCIGD